jgi:saccharopine dehydrogenase-like NADP-dependent oxidoreductase
MSTLVVGGYGSVGRVICRELARSSAHDDEVRVAGRDRPAAIEFASTLPGPATGVRIDLSDLDSWEGELSDADRVVVCVDQEGTSFVDACLGRGIDYVDVTASDEFLRRLESLDEHARTANATAVLSVGLSPGLTNLLAARLAGSLEMVSSIEISVLLGVGEAFGPAASRWTLERIGRPFSVETAGASPQIRGFTDPRTVAFPGFGRRRAYRFDLADQHVLARTLGVPEVATRLCFDSKLLTRTAAAMARSGVYPSVLEVVGSAQLARLFEVVELGSNEFALVVEAAGDVDSSRRRRRATVLGHEQSRGTGIVAARVVEQLIQDDLRAGVYHSNQVIDAAPIVADLRERGYRFSGLEASSETTTRTSSPS